MKKLFRIGISILVICISSLGLLSSETEAADECVINNGDVLFSAANSSIKDLEVKLRIKTKQNCSDNKITVTLYEYDKCITEDWFGNCDDTITFSGSQSNSQDSILLQTNPENDIILEYTGDEDDCEKLDLPSCLIYIEIKEGSKLIYSSRERIISIAKELSEIEIEEGKEDTIVEEVSKLLQSKDTSGLLLRSCDEIFGWAGSFFTDDKSCALGYGNNDWSLDRILGVNEVGEDGEILENEDKYAQVIQPQQFLDPNSPCYVAPGGKLPNGEVVVDGAYNPNCYELLAPIPGFESYIGDPEDKVENIKDINGRVHIVNLQEFKIGDFVNSIFQISLGVLMVLAVIMIVVAGVEYMTVESIGSKSQAKQRITGALGGLILALGIFVILRTINPRLLEIGFGENINSVEIKLDEENGDGGSIITPGNVSIGSKPQACPEGIINVGGFKICKSIEDDFTSMITQAKNDGVILGGSAARSFQRQVELRIKNCKTPGFDIYNGPSNKCSPQTARPGYSRHESGLAVDFNCNGGSMTKTSPCFQWLKKNSFLKNLPSEPWHWSIDGK